MGGATIVINEKFIQALLETLAMVGTAGLLAAMIGLPLGVVVFMTQREKPWQNTIAHQALGLVINITRSLPFVILMILLIPLSRFLLGKSIGWQAATVPLSFAAISFYARLVQTSLNQLPGGLIEAGTAMGATSFGLIRHILLPEATPSLIEGIITTLIALVGYSAMAGLVGGGGLGTLAYHYGFMRYETDVMIGTTCLLLILVQLLQWIGDKSANVWYKKN